jgi:protoporphyrinogen/coproporphyrinogen III oxidase
MTSRHVVIVGGGITGLAVAYYLEKRAKEQRADIRYTLIESDDRVGGKVVTDYIRDFIIEGGPDSFVTDKPWCLALCHELGLTDLLLPNNQLENKVYMLHHGKLVQFPSGFRLSIPTQLKPFVLTSLISPLGKLRMAMEYFLPPRPQGEDESLGSFIGRRLGREAVDKFAGPLMAGIFVSDPDRLSMRGTFPAFLEMEKKYGSLIRAAKAMKKNPPKRTGPPAAGNAMFNTLKGGMYNLIEAMRDRLSGKILTGTTVQSLEKTSGGFTLHLAGKGAGIIMADEVVLTVPAPRAAGLVNSLHSELAGMLKSIRFVSTATVSMAYLLDDIPAERPLDGFGVLIPASEKRKLIAITWASTKFRHRAPPGCVLLRAFIGGYRDEALAEQDADAMVSMVQEEFASLLGIKAQPVFSKVYRWTKGNPQYDVGHLDRVASMESLANTVAGLHLAGSSYHGIGMPDCIKSAIKAVDRILPIQ